MSIINSILQPIADYLPENNRLERIWKLAQVDFKKRYYNDKLGLLWALLNPAFRIAIYFFVFKLILKIQIEKYPLFLFSGLLFWMAFNESTVKAMGLIKSKKYLIENIQFNQVDLFISATMSVFFGLFFNLMVYYFICLLFGINLTINSLFVIVIVLNVFMICLGSSLVLATIGIYVKDIKHLWAILILLGFWTSGIFFKGEEVINYFPPIKFLNPFVGLIMNMRSISMFGLAPDYYLLFINFIYGFLLLLIGVVVYRKFSHKALELL